MSAAPLPVTPQRNSVDVRVRDAAVAPSVLADPDCVVLVAADAEPEFQRRCLALLTEAVADGEADPGNLAYLTDRVLCAEGEPQRYGTQFWTGPHDTDGTGRLQVRPIADREQLTSAVPRSGWGRTGSSA